jgi:hypothetical protein
MDVTVIRVVVIDEVTGEPLLDPVKVQQAAQALGFGGEPRAGACQAGGEPDRSQPEPEPEPEEDPDAQKEFTDEEREFRSYVRYAIGEDPDYFDKRQYKKLFNEYREWKQKREGHASSVSRKKEDIPARVKELYRVLVRRLHPDTGRERSNPHIQKLWHDLQDAYAALDVERLEILLAITDLHESGSAVRSSLFHLRQVSRQLRNQLDALKLRIHQAKKSPAWTFWHAKDRKAAGEKLRAAAQKRVLKSKEELTRLEREVERWKEESLRKKAPRRAAFGNPPAKPGSSSKKKKRNSDTQDLFEF